MDFYDFDSGDLTETEVGTEVGAGLGAGGVAAAGDDVATLAHAVRCDVNGGADRVAWAFRAADEFEGKLMIWMVLYAAGGLADVMQQRRGEVHVVDHNVEVAIVEESFTAMPREGMASARAVPLTAGTGPRSLPSRLRKSIDVRPCGAPAVFVGIFVDVAVDEDEVFPAVVVVVEVTAGDAVAIDVCCRGCKWDGSLGDLLRARADCGGRGRSNEARDIAAGGKVYAGFEFVTGLLVILRDALADLGGCDTNDRIDIGVIVGGTMKDLDAEQVGATALRLFHEVAQQRRISVAVAEVMAFE